MTNKKTPLNRHLQREILEFVSQSYPVKVQIPQKYWDAIEKSPEKYLELIANLQYLKDYGLINVSITPPRGWHPEEKGIIGDMNATTAGAEIVENDGGVSALIAEIENTIANSSEPIEVKKHALSLLKDFAITGKDELIKRLINAALNNSGQKVSALLSQILS